MNSIIHAWHFVHEKDLFASITCRYSQLKLLEFLKDEFHFITHSKWIGRKQSRSKSEEIAPQVESMLTAAEKHEHIFDGKRYRPMPTSVTLYSVKWGQLRANDNERKKKFNESRLLSIGVNKIMPNLHSLHQMLCKPEWKRLVRITWYRHNMLLRWHHGRRTDNVLADVEINEYRIHFQLSQRENLCTSRPSYANITTFPHRQQSRHVSSA